MRYLTAIAVALFCASWAPAHPPKAYVVAPPTPKVACVCGDACKCLPGKCPNSCPVVVAPPVVLFQPTPLGGCPNGVCPVPQTQYQFQRRSIFR